MTNITIQEHMRQVHYIIKGQKRYRVTDLLGDIFSTCVLNNESIQYRSNEFYTREYTD